MWKQRPVHNTHINVKKYLTGQTDPMLNLFFFFKSDFSPMLLSPGPNHPSLLHLHQERPTFHILFLLLWIDQLDIFWQWHLKFTVIEIVTKLFSIGCVHIEFDVRIFSVGQQFCEVEAIFVKEMSWCWLQYCVKTRLKKKDQNKALLELNWKSYDKMWRHTRGFLRILWFSNVAQPTDKDISLR